MTEPERYNIPGVWSRLYHELKDSPWGAEDVDVAPENAGLARKYLPAAQTLGAVYERAHMWSGADPSASVLATIRAAHARYPTLFLTTDQVWTMAENFAVFYPDRDVAVQQYLDEHHEGMPVEYLNSVGRVHFDLAVERPSEIWISESPAGSGTGEWVFNRPA